MRDGDIAATAEAEMRRVSFFVLIAISGVLPGAGLCPAQESDTIITSKTWRPITVFEQITDAMERKALLALYERQDPYQKEQLARAFLSAYPRSAFLAQVYEIAAKASIDLGDFARALSYAGESLRLLPENPLLIVPIANLEVGQGLTAKARESAQRALEYLERFGRPSSIVEHDWPQLERELRASSWFALGRAGVLEALSTIPGQHRTELLQQSDGFLLRARALNPADPEIVYLMGLSYWSQGRTEAAASSFGAAYRLRAANTTIGEQALARLRQIYETSAPHANITFEAFLGGLRPPEGSPNDADSQEVNVTPHSEDNEVAEYAGSKACQTCHIDIYRNWSLTGMARMLRPYAPESVIGDFSRDNQFYLGDELTPQDGRLEVRPDKDRSLFARMIIEGGRHLFLVKQTDGQWHRYAVDYVIGSKWQQAYATRLPNGRVHVFPVQYSALHRRWINFWKVIDLPGSQRADPRNWERLDSSTSYQANCAACHTSQLRNVTSGGFEADHVEFREAGIGCEMCHGPSGRHVAAMREGRPYPKEPLDPPVDFRKISRRDSVDICAQCHMQSAMREPGPGGELNYAVRGAQFFQRSKSRSFAEFSRRAFYLDGRFRETTFIVESMMRTRCFRQGGVTCVHCHDPHPNDVSSNPTSLGFRDRPDQMCLQCHTQLTLHIEAHTRHAARSEGSRCVSCHMPRIMNALPFRAGSHQFDEIPNSEMTLRFGQESSPNACLLCHKDRDAKWIEQKRMAWVRR